MQRKFLIFSPTFNIFYLWILIKHGSLSTGPWIEVLGFKIHQFASTVVFSFKQISCLSQNSCLKHTLFNLFFHFWKSEINCLNQISCLNQNTTVFKQFYQVSQFQRVNPPVDLYWFFEKSIWAFISNWNKNRFQN